MRQSKSRLAIGKFRDKGQKVYIPNDARDNHYILAQFELPQKVVDNIKIDDDNFELESIVKFIANKLIRLGQQFEINNLAIINKQKLVRVRYSRENEIIETQEQLVFFYNPAQSSGYQQFIDLNARHYQFQLLFLAHGDEIRQSAVLFHKRVASLLAEFANQCKLSSDKVKIQDHQHITYDLTFNKSSVASRAHGFRELAKRYQEQGYSLPNNINSQSYLVAKLPLAHFQHYLGDVDYFSTQPFAKVYELINNCFKQKQAQVLPCQSAIIASEQLPIIRISDKTEGQKLNELILINLANTGDSQCLSELDGTRYHSYIYLVFAATDEHRYKASYGKFVNRASEVIKAMYSELGLTNKSEQLTLRFYQHLSYKLLHEAC